MLSSPSFHHDRDLVTKMAGHRSSKKPVLIDFVGARQEFSEILGEKEAKAFFGPIDLLPAEVTDLGLVGVRDFLEDLAFSDGLPKDGWLIRCLVSNKAITGKYYKRLERKKMHGILMAVMLAYGFSPSFVLGEHRCNQKTLAESFLVNEDFFHIKSLFPEKNIEVLFERAFQALRGASWNSNYFGQEVARNKQRYMTVVPKEDSPLPIDIIMDIRSSYEALLGAAKKILRSGEFISQAYVLTKTIHELPALWVISGADFDTIFEAIAFRFKLISELSKTTIPDDIFSEAMAIKRASILAGFPAYWEHYGVKAHHFLGRHLLNTHAFATEISGKRLYMFYSETVESLIGRYASDSDYAKLFLSKIKGHFPEITSIQNVVYDASRSGAWVSHSDDITPAIDLLAELHKNGIHHALTCGDAFASMADDNSSRKIFMDYLENGTKWRMAAAQILLDSNKIEPARFISLLSKRSEFQNLAKIFNPCSEVMAQIPSKYRKIFLMESLDC